MKDETARKGRSANYEGLHTVPNRSELPDVESMRATATQAGFTHISDALLDVAGALHSMWVSPADSGLARAA